MLASEKIDGYISLAGTPDPIDITISKQLSKQSAELAETATSYFKELKKTGDVKEVHPFLATIFSKQNLPFFLSWMQYNPKEELKKLSGKEVQLNIIEIKRPELEAQLVGSSIARQIESRISYRRAIKMAIAASIRMNAEGIKVQISGRLNGAEMARSESYKEGRIPLSTFRADIDYALVEAQTTYGKLGIKVWIMKGEVYGKRELSPLVGLSKKQTGPNKGGGNQKRQPRRRK